jgi:dipeptidyl aminopeptidase/acylaminoacyl peptidase
MAFATMSREGGHIAFTEYHQTNKVMRLQNGALEDIFADSALRANAVASPDGRFLAYSSDRSGRNQVWISDANGRNERMLTTTGGAGAMRPAWSPDGTSIVYECREGTSSNLCTQRLASKKATTLIQMGSDAILPSLSRDGKRLYFTSNVSGGYEGYRQRLQTSPAGELLADGKPEQLTHGNAIFLYESYSGKTLYLRGGLPSLALLNVPVDTPSIPTAPARLLNPNYVLTERAPSREGGTIVKDGLLVMDLRSGVNHFLLYREGTRTPVEAIHPQQLDPIDGVSWEPSRNSLLFATQSKPTGTLRLLSYK